VAALDRGARWMSPKVLLAERGDPALGGGRAAGWLATRREQGDRTGDTPIDGPLRPGYPGHMSAQAQAILEQALRLSADERAHLADALQRSLEDEASGLPPDEVTRLWNDEIKRRLARARDRVVRGEPLGRSADEVYADAEVRIQEIRARRGR